jgi:copper transport protein
MSSLIDTTYGLVLLGKLLLVLASLLGALLARRRLRHSMPTATANPLGRAVRVEAAALAGVLAVTAVLVSVAPPGPATADLAAPPAPAGPVVPAGTLAGVITVIATASAGQLVLRMSAPGRDDLGSDNTNPEQPSTHPADYRLAALWSVHGTAPQSLTVRGCGAGCFTGPMNWRPGTNQLHLSITAPPWPAGTATLDIPWPPRTDPALLPTVLTAMRAVPHLTVYQAVTSDYTGYPGNEIELPFSGADFLATEPYNSGGGNPVVLNSTPGETEIGMAFPSGIAIHLFVGADHRILREVATTPNHLITSTFEYPPNRR